MLDGGRARTGEDMPFEMVVADFFFCPRAPPGCGLSRPVLVLHTFKAACALPEKFYAAC